MFKALGLSLDKRNLWRFLIAAAFTVVFLSVTVLIAMSQSTPTSVGTSNVVEGFADATTRGLFVESARDTLPDGGPVPLPETRLEQAFELLYENAYMAFYYREDRNILAFRDKRINYVWKSGLDIPFAADVDDFARALTPEQRAALDEDIFRVVRMSPTFVSMANSIIVVEFYTAAQPALGGLFTAAANISNTSSADPANTTTMMPTAYPNRFFMTTIFHSIDLTVNVHITFDGTRVIYDIPNDEITGEGRGVLSAIHLTPFKGATGGVIERMDPVTGSFNRETVPMIPGYFVVPDGSGALIRFNYNYVSFTEYRGHVYGVDYGQATNFQMTATNHVPLNHPALPVFGVSHGNGQAGFIAYSTRGEEYMEIVVMPHQNTTYYNWIYPRFVYNRVHLHIFDLRGSGFLLRRNDVSNFDVTMVYDFLANYNGQQACYVGMAGAYRAFLMETGQLGSASPREPGVRIDFLMSDISPNIVSHTQVTLTSADDIKRILNELTQQGAQNITTNLLGWQRNGITGGRAGRVSFRDTVGSRSDFVSLADFARQNNIRLALAQDYFVTNTVQMFNLNNAAQHLNGQFITTDISNVVPPAAPVTEQTYARPIRSAEWLAGDLNALGFTDYHAVFGISNRLISDHTGSGMLVQDSRALFEDAFGNIDSHGLFLHKPNQYLLRFAEASLDTPVFSSQHLIQTDTVPFLQMVLHGTMDLFAPYSNFSFYTDRDVLRMIDYNVMPSFVITNNPSHLLQHTNSAHFYTTEYARYQDMIVNISALVQDVLGQVVGFEWTNRQVVESGVVVNTYVNSAGVTRQIKINYTDNPVSVNGTTVPPVSVVVN